MGEIAWLTTLNNSDIMDLLLQQHDHCYILENQGLCFAFVWTASHVGIKGTEEADAAMRSTKDSIEIDDVPIRLVVAKSAVKYAAIKTTMCSETEYQKVANDRQHSQC